MIDFIKESKYLKNYNIYKEYMDNLRKCVDKPSKYCFMNGYKELQFRIDSEYYEVILITKNDKEFITINKYNLMDENIVEQTTFLYESRKNYNMQFKKLVIKSINSNEFLITKKDMFYLDNECVNVNNTSKVIDYEEINNIKVKIKNQEKKLIKK